MNSVNRELIKDYTLKKLDEAYKHFLPYINREQPYMLREMCENCEMYCGKRHNYEYCKDNACFMNWLAFAYLDWATSYEAYPDEMGR